MKTLKKLGISPTPWRKHEYPECVCIEDKTGLPVAVPKRTGDEAMNTANTRLIAIPPKVYKYLCEAVKKYCYDDCGSKDRKCSYKNKKCCVKKWLNILRIIGDKK